MDRHLPGSGWITITVHGPRTNAGLRITVDGSAVEVAVPTTFVPVPVPASRHQVDLAATAGITRYGEASTQVDLAPGAQVDLHYSLPMWLWGAGQLDATAQPRSWSPDWRHIGIAVGGSLLLCCVCGAGATVWALITG